MAILKNTVVNGNLSVTNDILATKFSSPGGQSFKLEGGNEFNITPSSTSNGETYINYRGGSSVVNIGKGTNSDADGRAGTLNAGNINGENIVASNFSSPGGAIFRSEADNEFNIYREGPVWLNFRGKATGIKVGNGAGAHGLGRIEASELWVGANDSPEVSINSSAINIGTGHHINMKYNANDYPVLFNHADGNIGLNAASNGLYLGYSNTGYVNFERSDGVDLPVNIKGTLSVNGTTHVKGALNADNYHSGLDDYMSRPAIYFDKPGNYLVGIGPNGTTNTIHFGPVTGFDGTWVTSDTFNSNIWDFQGDLKADDIDITGSLTLKVKDDNLGLYPVANDWNSIGSDSKRWYKGYINNLTSKTIYSRLYTGGALDLHPESGGNMVALSYYANDMANLIARGGKITITNKTTGATIANGADCTRLVDCSPSYLFFTVGAITDVVEIVMTSPVSYSWGSQFGIGFGTTGWGCKDIKWELGNSSEWKVIDHITSNNKAIWTTGGAGPGTGAQSWYRMRITLTNFYGTSPRIGQIWSLNYNSTGLKNGFLGTDGGTIYGDLAINGDITANNIPTYLISGINGENVVASETIHKNCFGFGYPNPGKDWPTCGPFISFGGLNRNCTGYTMQLQAAYGDSETLYFRTQNDDNGTTNAWTKIATEPWVANQIKSAIKENITIGTNGNWNISGNDTGVKAQGPEGPQGPQGPANGPRGLQGPRGYSGSVVGVRYEGSGNTVSNIYLDEVTQELVVVKR